VVFVFFSHSCSRWLDSQTLETQIQPSTVYCRPQGYCQGRLGWLEGRVLGADTCSWLINKLTACHSVACSSGWHAQNSQTHGARVHGHQVHRLNLLPIQRGAVHRQPCEPNEQQQRGTCTCRLFGHWLCCSVRARI